MATNVERLVVSLEASITKYERTMNRALGVTNDTMGKIEKRQRKAMSEISGMSGRGSLRNFASALSVVEGPLGGTASRIQTLNSLMRQTGPAAAAAAIGLAAVGGSAVAVARLADSYTRFENRLKTAGLEGENLISVVDTLFEIANRNGVEIEALGTVYSRASLAAKELGANEETLEIFVNAVSNALRVQGATAESSRGALLQLSQALGADIVRAEEFNSILEGARPLAQAAANGITRFGGSVAKLRQEIVKGQVSSREFFEGILRDAPALALQASQATLTLGNSWTVLTNQLTRGIGTVDNALSATEKLSAGILFFANNLDTVGEALSIVTAAISGRLVSSLAASTVAMGKNITASVRSAIADEAAAKAALDRARATYAASLATTGDTSAQYARIAALKQITILEQNYQQTLVRRRLAQRAASIGGAVIAGASSLLGGPVGIGITALAGGYLILSARAEAAAERTRNLQKELRNLGYLAQDTENGIDGVSKSLQDMANDQIQKKLDGYISRIKEIREGGIFGGLSVLFDPENIPVDQVAALARQWGATNVLTKQTAKELEEVANRVGEGTISAKEFEDRMKAITRLNPSGNIDNLVISLRAARAEAEALARATADFQMRLTNSRSRAASMKYTREGRAQRSEAQNVDRFFADRTRAASLDEETRAIERRADAIVKESEKLKTAITRTQALAQAEKELAIERSAADQKRISQEIEKAAESDRAVINELNKAIDLFGDERAQAIDAAVSRLSPYVSDENIEAVKRAAEELYRLAEAKRLESAMDDKAAAEEQIRLMKQEADLIGLIGGALAEEEFYQSRLNDKLAAGIPLKEINIDLLRKEAQEYGRIAGEQMKHAQVMQDNIRIQDGLRQGMVDIGLAATRGADDFGDAVGNMIRRVAELIFELKVLRPLVESAFGGFGTSGGFSLGGLIPGFATGTANTGGRRGQPRGIVHGQEAVIPLPSGGKVPVDLRMPDIPAQKQSSSGTTLNVSVDARGATSPAEVEMAVKRGMREVLVQVPSIAVNSVAAAKTAGGSVGRALRK